MNRPSGIRSRPSIDALATFRIVGWRAITSATACSKPPRVHLYADAQRQGGPAKVPAARTNGNQDTLLADMRASCWRWNQARVHGQRDEWSEHGTSLMPARVGAILASAFGGLAPLLAGIGLYGVIAFSLARRSAEIGLRMALGAKPGMVLSMVMRRGSRSSRSQVAGGLLAGAAASALRGVLTGSPRSIRWQGSRSERHSRGCCARELRDGRRASGSTRAALRTE